MVPSCHMYRRGFWLPGSCDTVDPHYLEYNFYTYLYAGCCGDFYEAMPDVTILDVGSARCYYTKCCSVKADIPDDLRLLLDAFVLDAFMIVTIRPDASTPHTVTIDADVFRCCFSRLCYTRFCYFKCFNANGVMLYTRMPICRNA